MRDHVVCGRSQVSEPKAGVYHFCLEHTATAQQHCCCSYSYRRAHSMYTFDVPLQYSTRKCLVVAGWV